MENPKHNNKHSNFILDGKQSLYLTPATTDGVSTSINDPPKEIQSISFATPYSISNISFDLSFAGSKNQASSRKSLRLGDSASTIKLAIEKLVETRQHSCLIEESNNQQFYDLDTFEGHTCGSGTSNCDLWGSRNGRRPSIESNDPYCGYYSQKQTDFGSTNAFGANYGRNFEGDNHLEEGQIKDGYDTELYPWLCTAYKIPKDSHPHMLVRVKNCEGVGNDVTCGSRRWYSITMSDGAHTTQMDYSLAANFPTVRDGKWHHHCYNLDETLDVKFGIEKSHIIDAMIWHRPGVLADGDFWIDEFSISSHSRVVTQLTSATVPTKSVEDQPWITKVQSVDLTSTGFDVTFEASTCVDLPLLNISNIQYHGLPETSSSFVVNITHVVARKQPLSGFRNNESFQLSYDGKQSTPLPWNVKNNDVEDAINQLLGLEDAVTVEKAGGTSCYKGQIFHVTYTNYNSSNATDLEGWTNSSTALFEIIKEENHRLNLYPVPGGMARSAMYKPQLTLNIASNIAMCDAFDSHTEPNEKINGCGFSFEDTYTPNVLSVTPTTGTVGTQLSIVLDELSLMKLSNETTTVRLGHHAVCDLTSIVGPTLQCIVSGVGSPGKVPVRVAVDPYVRIFSFFQKMSAVFVVTFTCSNRLTIVLLNLE